MDAVLIIGRVLFALLWVGAGFAHFKNLEAMSGYATYKKVPAAKLAVLGSGLTFLVGGILIILGAWIDLAAALIAITVILAAIIFHQFWKESDANTKMQEQMAFNKANNITPIGVTKRIKDIIDGVYDQESGKKQLKAAQETASYQRMSEKDLLREIKRLEKAMLDAAKNLEFEKAAELRDQLKKLRVVFYGAEVADS
jgi:uncharacterized membrane protein YphA (DoxX/SURF4 family)